MPSPRVLSLCLLLLAPSGCDFGGVVLRNVPWFFRTPRPAPRQDVPDSDGAALSVLWIGHATALIQIGERYILTDPVFTERVGTFSRRVVAVGLQPGQLPATSITLVSHRHFDHLSKESLRLIAERTQLVVAPEGAGADIPAAGYDTRELGWWQTLEHDGVRVTAVPVQHEGSRLLHDGAGHPRSYTGYVIEYRGVTVYFAGDTAYRAALFSDVKARFGRIDLALLPIGPITPVRMMQPHHLDPEQAVAALVGLGADRMVPIHFGTFLHSYDQPGDCERRLDEAAAAAGPEVAARISRLQIGERRVLLASTSAASAPPR